MYRINRLNRNVLITPDEVLFHMPSDQSVSERQISQNIIIAEERFIADALCFDFYEDFISQKNEKVTEENQEELIIKINDSLESMGKNTITSNDLPIGTIVNAIELVDNLNYVELWYRYLWKITAECVDFLTTVPSWLRHTEQGQQMNNPKVIGGNSTNSASGEAKDVKFKLDSALQDRINPLLARMHEWICKNKDKYELYCKECESCGCDGTTNDSIIKKTNYVTGIYDD